MPRMLIPIPEDFREKARNLNNPALKELYGVSDVILARWRKQTGVRPPKINRKGQKRLPPEMDTPEQIRMCLNCRCPQGYCDGNCVRMRMAKQGVSLCCT